MIKLVDYFKGDIRDYLLVFLNFIFSGNFLKGIFVGLSNCLEFEF